MVVDYYSRYIEIANLPTLSTSTTVERLKVIFVRFGVPEILVTDNGPQQTLPILPRTMVSSTQPAALASPRAMEKRRELSAPLNSYSAKAQILRKLSWHTELHL